MLTVNAIPETQPMWEPPPTQPLNEVRWQAWMQKGLVQERRSYATTLKVIKGISIVALLAWATLLFNAVNYQLALQSIVTAGAIFVMRQAIHARGFAFAAMFGALALLFNPVVPLVHFFGGWQRAVMAASTIPFFLSPVRGIWVASDKERRTS